MLRRIQLIVLAAFSLAVCCGSTAALAQSVSKISPDMLAIQGRWIRTDAPYVIELRHAQGGSLQTLYFNPKSTMSARPMQQSRVALCRS